MIPNIVEITDPETNLKRTISLDENRGEFALNVQNGIPQDTFNANSLDEIRELLNYFQKTYSGKKLLREEIIETLLTELSIFYKKELWKDPKQLQSMINSFKEIVENAYLIPAA